MAAEMALSGLAIGLLISSLVTGIMTETDHALTGHRKKAADPEHYRKCRTPEAVAKRGVATLRVEVKIMVKRCRKKRVGMKLKFKRGWRGCGGGDENEEVELLDRTGQGDGANGEDEEDGEMLGMEKLTPKIVA